MAILDLVGLVPMISNFSNASIFVLFQLAKYGNLYNEYFSQLYLDMFGFLNQLNMVQNHCVVLSVLFAIHMAL